MIRQLMRFLASVLPWLVCRPTDGPREHLAGSTRLFPCLCGVEQRADGSWWLVFATLRGDGLPDATRITAEQATDIASQLRRTRSA